MADTETFNNVDDAKWLAIKNVVKERAGLDIQSNTGEEKVKGVTFKWDYDGSSTLQITIVDTSWYDPSAASIEEQLAKWIDGLPSASG